MHVFQGWQIVSKRDPRAVGLFSRHYSSKKNNKTIRHWLATGITAPGEDITLMRSDCSALFVWLKQKYNMSNQEGVYCAVFRNEGSELSSTLILEAEKWAWEKWQGERLYTYVDPGAVRHKRDPGRCFKKAGWKLVRDEQGKPLITTQGLLIFEKLPQKERTHEQG